MLPYPRIAAESFCNKRKDISRVSYRNFWQVGGTVIDVSDQGEGGKLGLQ